MDHRVLEAVTHEAGAAVLELPPLNIVKEHLVLVLIEVGPLIEDQLRVVDDALHRKVVVAGVDCAADAVLVFGHADGSVLLHVLELAAEQQMLAELVALLVNKARHILHLQLLPILVEVLVLRHVPVLGVVDLEDAGALFGLL